MDAKATPQVVPLPLPSDGPQGVAPPADGPGGRLWIGRGPRGATVLVGEIDCTNAALMRAALQAGAAESRVLTVDLRAICYLDHAAVEVLFDHAHLDLHILVRVPSAVAKVMDICGLDRIATVEQLPSGHLPGPGGQPAGADGRLRAARESERVTGLAIGTLMVNRGLTSDRAWRLLEKTARQLDRDPADLAAEIAATGRLPAPSPAIATPATILHDRPDDPVVLRGGPGAR